MYYFLIGFMGVGKSTIGRYASNKLKIPICEMDEEIEENEGMSIKEIFSNKGEKYFRRLETDLLKSLPIIDHDVIVSCGGGVATFPENVEIMKRKGEIIYLEASLDSLVKRLEGSINRPLINKKNLRENIFNLLNRREKIYINCSDYMLNTENLTVEQIGNSLCEIIIKEIDNL